MKRVGRSISRLRTEIITVLAVTATIMWMVFSPKFSSQLSLECQGEWEQECAASMPLMWMIMVAVWHRKCGMVLPYDGLLLGQSSSSAAAC